MKIYTRKRNHKICSSNFEGEKKKNFQGKRTQWTDLLEQSHVKRMCELEDLPEKHFYNAAQRHKKEI